MSFLAYRNPKPANSDRVVSANSSTPLSSTPTAHFFSIFMTLDHLLAFPPILASFCSLASHSSGYLFHPGTLTAPSPRHAPPSSLSCPHASRRATRRTKSASEHTRSGSFDGKVWIVGARHGYVSRRHTRHSAWSKARQRVQEKEKKRRKMSWYITSQHPIPSR